MNKSAWKADLDLFEVFVDDELKQTVLKSLILMVEQNGRESIEVFKTSYTPEDWQWLVDELTN